MEETGARINVPPLRVQKDEIAVSGKKDSVNQCKATNMSIYQETANSVIYADVNAPEWLHKFIIGKEGENIRRITQDCQKCNEVKKSFHMELEGLKRCLDNLEEYGLTVSTLVTERPVQVKKYMKEEHKNKGHYIDVWHLSKGSRAYKKLKEIVESPYLLRDIEKLFPCHQTYQLEVFHSVVTHYAPKSTHFFFPAMQARLLIAALHYNENCSKQQSMTCAGQLRWKVCYPKSKKGHEAVVKPCKKESTSDYIQELKEAVVTRRASLPTYEQASKVAHKALGDVPDNLTENYAKVDKAPLVEKHKSRFPFKSM